MTTDKASVEQMPKFELRDGVIYVREHFPPYRERTCTNVEVSLYRALLDDRKRLQALVESAKEVFEDVGFAEFPYSDGHRAQHFIEAVAKLRAALEGK